MSKPLRVCRLCNLEAYTASDLQAFVVDKKSKHGKAKCCKSCRRGEYLSYDLSNRDARRKKHLDHYYDVDYERRLMRTYGITIAQYNNYLELQNNCCAICDSHVSVIKGSLCVDHCHSTGRVRGLLCRHCNLGLGHFKDNTGFLNQAVSYLRGQ